MQATDLSPEIWNAIADLVTRSQSSREIYFVTVKSRDAVRKLIYVEDFGDIGIPLVAHHLSYSYFDTQPTGANVVAGVPLPTKSVKREDVTQQNPAFRTEIVLPAVGQLVVVLDPWGAKRFPICIGQIHSKSGYWEAT